MRRVVVVRVVNDQPRLVIERVDVDDLEQRVGAAHDAVLTLRTEPDRLAVLEPDREVVAGVGLLQRLEGAVVEDVAVLVDLDERRAACCAAARSTAVRCLRSESIVRATNVASAPSASDTGLNGESSEPIGVDLVILPSSEVGEYWPLVRP